MIDKKHIRQTMDWSKYSIEGWLKQYGAFISVSRMRGGDFPDDLSINQIYWLIRENVGQSSSKKVVVLTMNDFEYEQIHNLLKEIRNTPRICKSAKAAIELFIQKSIRGVPLRELANEYCLGKTSAESMIFAGKYYLAGHDKRLRLDCPDKI